MGGEKLLGIVCDVLPGDSVNFSSNIHPQPTSFKACCMNGQNSESSQGRESAPANTTITEIINGDLSGMVLHTFNGVR